MTTPLTPPNCDLRDFQYMPLDVVRLRDSELVTASTGEEFAAAVLLWCAAWHQVPAASLPDDDRQLSSLAGYGRAVKEWAKVRAGALRGFVKCSDGRLYHPVVAEKAREAWDAKLQQRYRTECARIKKEAQRHNVSPEYPTFEAWVSRGTYAASPEGRPGGQPATVPGDIPPVSRLCPPGNTIQGKGREGNIKAEAVPGALGDSERRALEAPIDDADPDWQAWREHRRALRKWTVASERQALGHLRQVLADGGDPVAVLRWALARSLGDLLDCHRRMRSDAERDAANDKRPGESLADASARRSVERIASAEERSGPTSLVDLIASRPPRALGGPAT
jgi:hypothetical protein